MQRMAIASIMAMKPEVIILDEPTSQLDPQGSEAVFKALQSLSKQGITVIMVEHQVEKLAAYRDRVMLLDQGQLIAMD
ncbi:ABC transporter ATP-binding protein, partial [Streptococcus suis]